MANAINDIISLAAKLRDCQLIVEKAESAERACLETEQRLADLRAQEAVARDAADRARDHLNQVEEGAKVQAEAIRKAAAADANKVRAELEEALAAKRAAHENACDKLSDEANELRATIASLEDEESRLAQSVTALKAELESIKSRLLG